MPLYDITRYLTRADDSFDRAAILRAAWTEAAMVPDLGLAEALRRRWRAARFERTTNRDLARRNRAYEEAAQTALADADGLARHYRYDVDRLRFERDRWHYGNSTARGRELPRFEAALKLARERMC